MDWKIFRGEGRQHDGIQRLPAPPPWRRYDGLRTENVGKTYHSSGEELEVVNAALYLRRPLLVTGPPGSGKSSLAHAIAWELQLGDVLCWPINSRSALHEGLYTYDAIARLRDANLVRTDRDKTDGCKKGEFEDIGKYITLGPLGTALVSSARPRVLLIDEIDKSDIDLPNDLLHVFEEGYFEIPELVRAAETASEIEVSLWHTAGFDDAIKATISRGKVRCRHFPIVVMTSNSERELPEAFLRRCVRLENKPYSALHLSKIIENHLGKLDDLEINKMIQLFQDSGGERGEVATDQLLNLLFVVAGREEMSEGERDKMKQILLRRLDS
jgi:MoxR-like ATPase